ncbi:hypothetical protein DFH06DRAFT_1476562 [Mycena polygramma]|nr:hypothetical protein DFH06DRAFT_1476562 [Mycena polygramma]
MNPQPCENCLNSRNPGKCRIDPDEVCCLPCRAAKMGCDRKVKFLFDSTKNDFFPTMELFTDVYLQRDGRHFRAVKKALNKRRRTYDSESGIASNLHRFKPDSVITRFSEVIKPPPERKETRDCNCAQCWVSRCLGDSAGEDALNRIGELQEAFKTEALKVRLSMPTPPWSG